MKPDVHTRLEAAAIRLSAQRAAIADHVLHAQDHPSADQVWTAVKVTLPSVSRATVYNTLRLFVRRGLLREFVLAPGRIVYDPHVEPHHHFIDDASGAIHDIPLDAIQVTRATALDRHDVREIQVVLRGRFEPPKKRGRA